MSQIVNYTLVCDRRERVNKVDSNCLLQYGQCLTVPEVYMTVPEVYLTVPEVYLTVPDLGIADCTIRLIALVLFCITFYHTAILKAIT